MNEQEYNYFISYTANIKTWINIENRVGHIVLTRSQLIRNHDDIVGICESIANDIRTNQNKSVYPDEIIITNIQRLPL